MSGGMGEGGGAGRRGCMGGEEGNRVLAYLVLGGGKDKNFTYLSAIMMTECTWWKSQVVIHTSLSTLLAVIWFIQLLRTIHAEAETVNMQAGEEAGYFSSLVNPFQYEEGR